MPKVIIANVDSDAMCGNDMKPEIHALSSLCCCRLIVLAEDEDLVVVPHSLSDKFINYINDLLGRSLSSRNAVEELGRAIADLIGETGRVMIKQDRNSGSAGNTVVTRYGETVLTGGSSTRAVGPDTDFEALAAELWPGMQVQRNTQVVIEAYHKPAQVYYSELWVPGADGSPELLNFGEMRMEPTFIGFEIPSQRMSQFDIADMAAHSMNLAREAGRRGFYGYMNIDSIVTESGTLFFNEVNGRMGDCTHVDYLARQLAGDDYGRTRVVLTYNWVRSADFDAVLKSLDSAGVLFDRGTRTGVLLPIEDVERTGVIDYMVIGTDLEHALDLEQRTLTAIEAA